MCTLANSEDPNEMQHYAAFHQSLHCLLKWAATLKASESEMHTIIKPCIMQSATSLIKIGYKINVRAIRKSKYRLLLHKRRPPF